MIGRAHKTLNLLNNSVRRFNGKYPASISQLLTDFRVACNEENVDEATTFAIPTDYLDGDAGYFYEQSFNEAVSQIERKLFQFEFFDKLLRNYAKDIVLREAENRIRSLKQRPDQRVNDLLVTITRKERKFGAAFTKESIQNILLMEKDVRLFSVQTDGNGCVKNPCARHKDSDHTS